MFLRSARGDTIFNWRVHSVFNRMRVHAVFKKGCIDTALLICLTGCTTPCLTGGFKVTVHHLMIIKRKSYWWRKGKHFPNRKYLFYFSAVFCSKFTYLKDIKSKKLWAILSTFLGPTLIGAVPAYKFSEGDGEIQLCEVDHTHDLLESEMVLLTSILIRNTWTLRTSRNNGIPLSIWPLVVAIHLKTFIYQKKRSKFQILWSRTTQGPSFIHEKNVRGGETTVHRSSGEGAYRVTPPPPPPHHIPVYQLVRDLKPT